MRSLSIRTNFLAQRISELARAVAGGSGSSELGVSLEILYDCLVRPIWDDISRARVVVIVPDMSLSSIPFSALRDSKRKKYLVQDVALIYAPSATFFVRSNKSSRKFFNRLPESILLLGDPEFDRANNPAFERLPHSAIEAGQISRVYQSSAILLGPFATKNALMQKFSDYDVIHIGSHAKIDIDYPMFSSLLLASKGGAAAGSKDNGELYAYEIYRLKIRKTRLIVLASCGSAKGMTSSVEGGVSSLITPFLAKGIPSVIGNLWQSDDMMSSVVMLKFHKYFKGGFGAAAALRKAQIDCLESKDSALRSPVAWGGFLTFGNA
jgi:CHAT domain-containing protein